MDHLVISPFWMIKALDEDNGKRTTPPLPLLEATVEVFIADKRKLLRLTAFECEVSFRVFSRKRGVEKMVVIEEFVEVYVTVWLWSYVEWSQPFDGLMKCCKTYHVCNKNTLTLKFETRCSFFLFPPIGKQKRAMGRSRLDALVSVFVTVHPHESSALLHSFFCFFFVSFSSQCHSCYFHILLLPFN